MGVVTIPCRSQHDYGGNEVKDDERKEGGGNYRYSAWFFQTGAIVFSFLSRSRSTNPAVREKKKNLFHVQILKNMQPGHVRTHMKHTNNPNAA